MGLLKNRLTCRTLVSTKTVTAFVFSITALSTATYPLIASSMVVMSQTEATMNSSYDCTQVGIDEIDPMLLTKEERIALMDKSLNRSMDSFSHCVSVAQQQMSVNNAGGSEGEGGFQQGTQTQNNGDSENLSANNATIEDSEEITLDVQNSANETAVKGTTPTERGIIPPKDNDKVICKLLYQEIKKTSDQAMREGLKQQYANYKCG